MVIKAFFSPPHLAVALSKLVPALLNHLSCLQHAIKQICIVPLISFGLVSINAYTPLITLLYKLMISSFKGVTASNITSTISAFAGPRLNHQAAILQGLKLVTTRQKEYLECKFIYADFKQALRHLLQISRICRSLNYHPEIFNVYNRIEIKLFSSVENMKCVTAKDCYMALFLQELHNKTAANAHELVLARVQQLI